MDFDENSTLSPQFVYNPGREIAIDEAMIKGRSSLKQYMSKKPIKRGIKVWVLWVLGESSTGYFSRLRGEKGPPQRMDWGHEWFEI